MDGTYMELLSTNYYDQNGKLGRLCFDSVFKEEARYASRIVILSAYYSIDFLKKSLKSVNKVFRKNCKVVFAFNANGGLGYEEQIITLKELKKWAFGIGFNDIRIYINSNFRIFHTKLYFFENAKRDVLLLGSANASNAGFSTNEELLLKTSDANVLVNRYIEKIDGCMGSGCEGQCNEISHIKNMALTVSDLIGFFRSGVIYFKPNRQINFSYNGLSLPQEILNRLNRAEDRPRYTSPGKAWGSFNIKLSLGLSDDTVEDEKNRVELSRHAVETCFGYWVPDTLQKKLNKDISTKSINKMRELEKVRDYIKDKGVGYLIDLYDEYLDDVEKALSTNNIKYDLDRAKEIISFKKTAERVERQLNSPRTISRVSSPLTHSAMPEIWEDERSKNDFIESFYEDISANLSNKSRSTINRICKVLDLSSGMTYDEVSEAFEDFFSNGKTWERNYWGKD